MEDTLDLVPNVPSELGIEAGFHLARLSAEPIAKMRATFPDFPDLCHDCAFRAGSIPNGCAPTVHTAIECVMKREPFYCHHGMEDGNPKQQCRGWLASTLELLVAEKAKAEGKA